MDNASPLIINSSQVVHETIDGETILMNLETGNYYSLDGTGGVVWELIDDGLSANQILFAFQDYFKNPDDDISSQIIDFVEDLLKEGLVNQMDEKDKTSKNNSTENLQVDFGNRFDLNVYATPLLNKYSDMQDILLLDPIHDVDEETGWPTAKSE